MGAGEVKFGQLSSRFHLNFSCLLLLMQWFFLANFHLNFIQFPAFPSSSGNFFHPFLASTQPLRQWFAGSSLAFPDFHMYELLDQVLTNIIRMFSCNIAVYNISYLQHKQMVPNCLANCPNLAAFMERCLSLYFATSMNSFINSINQTFPDLSLFRRLPSTKRAQSS